MIHMRFFLNFIQIFKKNIHFFIRFFIYTALHCYFFNYCSINFMCVLVFITNFMCFFITNLF
jgi:hypothetical protein